MPTAHTSPPAPLTSYTTRKDTVRTLGHLEEIAREMMFANLVHLKSFLMVLTAAVGAVAGGTMVNSYVGQRASQSFILDLSPSALTISQNSSSTTTVTVTSMNGYSGTVGLSVYYPGQKLATKLNPASVTVPANGIAKSTLTVSAGSTIGTYNIVVIGLASSHSRTSYSSAMLTVQVVSNQDFTIIASPSNITSLVGSTDTTTITVTSINGFTGNVSLTVTAPFGYITVTGSQTPLTLGTTATSTLTIATSATNTAIGTYTITVTGTSGSITHTTIITLNVVDPTPPPPVVESLKMNGYEYANSTSLTLIIQNTGNTSLTLSSYTIRDSSGDAWTMTSWAGPTLAPNAGGMANIYIANNCPGCTYTGITGLFQQFTPGQTYTVILTTARGTQVQFIVTR